MKKCSYLFFVLLSGVTGCKVDDPGPGPIVFVRIPIENLEQLDAIRYDPVGIGKPDRRATREQIIAYEKAFPDLKPSTVYASEIYRGYKLMRDLDFTDPDSYASGKVNADWVEAEGGLGWEPIGLLTEDYTKGYASIFDGQGHTISNLYVNETGAIEGIAGLFYSNEGTIRNLGLIEPKIIGALSGALVGINVGAAWENPDTGESGETMGKISACYVKGGNVEGTPTAGGLVGENSGFISACYVKEGITKVLNSGPALAQSGGLVGINTGTIVACYVNGRALEQNRQAIHVYSAGLVGSHAKPLQGKSSETIIRASYAAGLDYDSLVGNENAGTVSTIRDSYCQASSTSSEEEKTESQLKTPTDYGTADTDIYSTWNVDIDSIFAAVDQNYEATEGDDEVDDPWDFGTASDFPKLKVDFDKDGTATAAEFGEQ